MASATVAPGALQARLHLGVTGHRESNEAFAANRARIAAVLEEVLDVIGAAAASGPRPLAAAAPGSPRLHTLLADGADHLAARSAITRGWEVVAPLPFGRRLNAAINAKPQTVEDGRALLAGAAAGDPETRARAEAVLALGETARVFELADQDAVIAGHFLARLEAPTDADKAQMFNALVSSRVALAARVMVEQSDLILAVWDGLSQHFVGGTGHTVVTALHLGAPVLWIDARAPEDWRVLHAPESLRAPRAQNRSARAAELNAIVRAALTPDGNPRPLNSPTPHADAAAASDPVGSLTTETWKAHSHPLSHAYRRVEALFGAEGRPFRRLRQSYETPDAIGQGTGREVLAALQGLPGADPTMAQEVETAVLRRFAWADGVSARLSDVYRGGMTASFVLSGAAIIAGVMYLPFVSADQKGPFAAVEFLLLAGILAITALGQRRRWHGRWFETRRVAEYFRHAPILLALGVARPPGRWPRGSETSWPEWYARQALREVGLPRVAVTSAYLRSALERLLDPHVTRQRDYHQAKAARLTSVHRNLDRLSVASFVLAVISVALFLALTAGRQFGMLSQETLYAATKWFTLLGVVLPTLGAAIAGIRYFGDFERFAAISRVTAEKLTGVHGRMSLLLAAPPEALDYAEIADLAHAADEIVVSEIESWQAVFGGKHVTVPA